MAHLVHAHALSFGQDQDPGEIVPRFADELFETSPVTRAAIDHVVVTNAAAEAFCGIANVATWTATQAALVDTPATRVETGPSSGLAGLVTARALIDAGHAEHVLLLGWEVMTQIPTPEATDVLARYMAEDEQALDLSLPGLVAMLTSAYQARYDVPDETLARIPVKAHDLATSNPIAQFRKRVTVDDVLGSRMIADPLRLYHCAPMTDGVAGLILGDDGPVEVLGMGGATDHLGYARRRGPPERFQATATAADRAFEDAGLGREAIDVAVVHDAFSVLEAVNMEDLGFAAEGEGLEALSLEDPLVGRPVVNPGGGLKARGHPVGATGVAQLVEAVDQLTGHAANQVDDADLALVHNIGGFGNNVHCAILEARP